jgi:hypothetical protein
MGNTLDLLIKKIEEKKNILSKKRNGMRKNICTLG